MPRDTLDLMSVSPFNRVRPTTTTLQEPSRIESSAGKSGGGPTIGEMLETALADISVKSMADVTAGVRAAGKKGKGVSGKGGVGGPAAPMEAPMQAQQPGMQTQVTQNEPLSEKIRQAVERATSTATSVVPTDSFDASASAGSHNALSSFSDDSPSTPAAQSNPDASVKAFALAPVRLRG